VRVPKDAEIEVSVEHKRKSFGGITGAPKGEKVEGGVTGSN